MGRIRKKSVRPSLGINAYIDACDAGTIALPPEFALLGNRPDRWKAEDVVRVRTHSLTRNASSELLRSKVMAAAGVELGAKLDLLRKQLSHGVEPRPVDGFDPAVMTDRVLRDFNLAVSPATFSKDRLAATLDEASLWTSVTPSGDIVRASFEEGSNNWAISADKTTTDGPYWRSTHIARMCCRRSVMSCILRCRDWM